MRDNSLGKVTILRTVEANIEEHHYASGKLTLSLDTGENLDIEGIGAATYSEFIGCLQNPSFNCTFQL